MPKGKKASKSREPVGAKIRKGMKKENVENSAGSGKMFFLKRGEEKTIQFLQSPSEFFEFDTHSFEDESVWQYVPCLAKNCPLCAEDDPDISKTSYRWVANVWNHNDKKIQVLENGRQLGEKVMTRFEKKPKSFVKRVFDIKKSSGKGQVTYDLDSGDDPAIDPEKVKKKLWDLEEYVQEQVSKYYGSDDEDDLTEDEDEEEVEAEEDEDIEDSEEEDDDEEDDEEEEEEEDTIALLKDSLDDFSDDDEEEDEEEEEDEPVKKKTGRPKAKTNGKTNKKKVVTAKPKTKPGKRTVKR